ncbi:CoA-transferase [Janibacter melonis]|uniref:CoA-transferase n=1 Tax=Janibacter melonis TaxID=262209 RepID=UPI003558C82C
MRTDKVVPLRDAVARYVTDGATVALEGFGHLIPSPPGTRSSGRRTGLTICRMTPDIITDQLLAAGCVDRLVASFFASGSAGSLYEIRRRVESHDPAPLAVEELSHYGMYCRYRAGAADLPFYPFALTRAATCRTSTPDPHGRQPVRRGSRARRATAQARRDDHPRPAGRWPRQRADVGITGAQQEAAYAAGSVVVTVEKVVAPEVIRSDPNRTILPAHAVDAVCHVPRGAHPRTRRAATTVTAPSTESGPRSAGQAAHPSVGARVGAGDG